MHTRRKQVRISYPAHESTHTHTQTHTHTHTHLQNTCALVRQRRIQRTTCSEHHHLFALEVVNFDLGQETIVNFACCSATGEAFAVGRHDSRAAASRGGATRDAQSQRPNVRAAGRYGNGVSTPHLDLLFCRSRLNFGAFGPTDHRSRFASTFGTQLIPSPLL